MVINLAWALGERYWELVALCLLLGLVQVLSGYPQMY